MISILPWSPERQAGQTMLEMKAPALREGEEEAEHTQSHAGHLASELPNWGPSLAEAATLAWLTADPMAQADPRGRPRSSASSPPRQARPASGEPPAASRRRGRGTCPTSPFPSMCQLPPGCPSNGLSARSHGAGEIEQGPERGLLRTPFCRGGNG